MIVIACLIPANNCQNFQIFLKDAFFTINDLNKIDWNKNNLHKMFLVSYFHIWTEVLQIYQKLLKQNKISLKIVLSKKENSFKIFILLIFCH